MLSGEALLDMLGDVLNKGMPFRFKASGSSMSPFIKDGDVLTVYPKRRSHIGKGAVVAYHHKTLNKIIIHRIVAKINDYYAVKGDNTTGYTDLVYETDILGHVSEVERNGKKAHIGLGPERFLISFLARFDLFIPLKSRLGKILHLVAKRNQS
jgi:signal peptidase I